MDKSMVIEAVDKVDGDLVKAVHDLVRQLSQSAIPPRYQELEDIVASPGTVLLVARLPEGKARIVGMLTLVVFRIPTGIRAWIEDVVVEPAGRGRGVGEALSREALRIAESRGARTVDLTSRPSREAANRLYRRIGFQPRDTNVYRYAFPPA